MTRSRTETALVGNRHEEAQRGHTRIISHIVIIWLVARIGLPQILKTGVNKGE